MKTTVFSIDDIGTLLAEEARRRLDWQGTAHVNVHWNIDQSTGTGSVTCYMCSTAEEAREVVERQKVKP